MRFLIGLLLALAGTTLLLGCVIEMFLDLHASSFRWCNIGLISGCIGLLLGIRVIQE